MASSGMSHVQTTRVPGTPIKLVHVLLLTGLSVGALVWGASLIVGEQESHQVEYLLLLGAYAVASASFILYRVRENYLRLFDIPLYLTVLVFVEFGLAPLECFIEPAQLDYHFHGNLDFLSKALLYVLFGMAAFWTGCMLIESRRGRKPPQELTGTSGRKIDRRWARIVQAAVVVYATSFATKVYLISHHVYSYLASESLYFQNLASMQVLYFIASLGTYGLIVVSIERYLHPNDSRRKLLFATMFTSECFWGLISGMKSLLIQNFIIVAVISSLIQVKFRKGWLVAALLGLIVLYPISKEYRSLVRSGEGTTFTGALEAGPEALRRVNRDEPGSRPVIESGWRSAVARLDLLQNVALLMCLGRRAAFVQDDARWWMLPFYPFVPRFIWHSKPILNEGGRFTIALGYGTVNAASSATAVTYPGDLYVSHGLLGIVSGMFLLGLVGQWLTNIVSRRFDKSALFIYASMFLTATNLEIGFFSFWSGFLKAFVIFSILAWIVYGARLQKAKNWYPATHAS